MKKNNWQILCYRFVLENRRLYALEASKASEPVIDYQKQMIQQVYNDMREACLADKTYIDKWEKVPVEKVETKKPQSTDDTEEKGEPILA